MVGSHKVVVELVAKGQKAAAEFKKVRDESDALGRSTTKSGGLLSGLGVSSEVAGKAMKGAAVAAAGLAAVKLSKFASDSVREFSSATAEVRAFQRVSGASAETSSKLVYAMRALGIDSTKAATGVFMLSKRVGSGATDLSQFGIALARTKDGSLDVATTIGRIGDAYKAMKDPAQRAALVQDAFGKGGKELIPILGKSRLAIKALFEEAARTNSIFSDDELEKGRKYQVAVRQLSETFAGFKRELGSAISPAITTITQGLSDLFQVASKSGAMKVLAVEIQYLLYPLTSTAAAVSALADAFGLSNHAAEQMSAATKVLTHFEKQLSEEVAAGNGHSKKANEARKQIALANGVLTTSQDAVSAALGQTTQKAIDAERALTTLKGTLFGFGDAQRGAQTALLDYADAQDRVQTSIDTLNAARVAGRQEGESEAQFASRIAGLQRDVERAYLDTASAHDKVAKAAVDALTSQKAYDAAAADPTARKALIRDLQEAKLKYKDTTGAIQAQIDKLNAYNTLVVPPKTLTVENQQANEAILATAALLGSIDSKTVTLTVALAGNAVGGALGNIERSVGLDLNGNGVVGRYGGGPVPGPTNRPVPVMAHGGEYVLSSDVVSRIKSGRASRGADTSSGGSGGPVYNVTVNSLVADANTGRHVARALAAYQRNGGQ